MKKHNFCLSRYILEARYRRDAPSCPTSVRFFGTWASKIIITYRSTVIYLSRPRKTTKVQSTNLFKKRSIQQVQKEALLIAGNYFRQSWNEMLIECLLNWYDIHIMWIFKFIINEKLISIFSLCRAITGAAIRNSWELMLSMSAALYGRNFCNIVDTCALVMDGMT